MHISALPLMFYCIHLLTTAGEPPKPEKGSPTERATGVKPSTSPKIPDIPSPSPIPKHKRITAPIPVITEEPAKSEKKQRGKKFNKNIISTQDITLEPIPEKIPEPPKDTSKPFTGKYIPKETVFTLPTPTSYILPTTTKNIIMQMMLCYPQGASLWRDEYKAVFENNIDLRAWLVRIITEKQNHHADIIRHLQASISECTTASNYHNEQASYYARMIYRQPSYESEQAIFHVRQRDELQSRIAKMYVSISSEANNSDALGEWLEYTKNGW